MTETNFYLKISLNIKINKHNTFYKPYFGHNNDYYNCKFRIKRKMLIYILEKLKTCKLLINDSHLDSLLFF